MPSEIKAAARNTHDADIRVMLVDDSAIIRGLITRSLKEAKGLTIVSTASNGQIAVDTLRRQPVDVIILDIEMPVMDGLTAIPLLKAIDPAVQIIMASTLTQKNADISLKAMALGATDYIPKPNSDLGSSVSIDNFNREIIDKIKTLGELARRKNIRLPSGISKPDLHSREKGHYTLRTSPVPRPDIIAIGSSTGGPQALFEVIRTMGGLLPQPIVITQHMPPTFTSILAEHISKQCNVTCAEGKDGQAIRAGQYYVAPGDFHMLIEKKTSGNTIKLTKEPPENYCRPSVDPMLRSLVEVYGKKILAVILTGMGQDGFKGCQKVVEAGGGIIAQNEATSVVWGMPSAVAHGGLCTSVLPLSDIGTAIKQIAMKVGL